MIDGLTLFAWFALALLFIVSVAAIVVIGSLPKKIAEKRNHPQVDAINVASWLGLLMGGIGWFFALVWAYTKAGNIGYEGNDLSGSKQSTEQEEISQLRARVAKLEASLANEKN